MLVRLSRGRVIFPEGRNSATYVGKIPTGLGLGPHLCNRCNNPVVNVNSEVYQVWIPCKGRKHDGGGVYFTSTDAQMKMQFYHLNCLPSRLFNHFQSLSGRHAA